MLEWLRERKAENRPWFWALIVLVCWTALLAVAPCVLLSGWAALDVVSRWVAPNVGEWMEGLMLIAIAGPLVALAPVVLLAFPAWAVLAIARRRPAVAGAVGVVQCLLLFSQLSPNGVCAPVLPSYWPASPVVSFLVSLPPLAVGILSLVTWWKSRGAKKERNDSLTSLATRERPRASGRRNDSE